MERDQQTVYFKDLLFSALYQWKKILVAALVLALLFGAIGVVYAGSSDAASSVSPETQQKIDQLQDTLERTEGYIESQTAYLENSIYMGIDPYAAYTAGFHIYVQPILADSTASDAQSECTAAVLRAYRSWLMGSEALKTVAGEFNTEVMYISELISYDTTVAGCLGVTVRGRTAQEAQAFADALLSIAQGRTGVISGTVGDHSITTIPIAVGPGLDTALFDAQKNARQKLTNLKNDLSTAKAELAKLMPEPSGSLLREPLLLAVLGAFAGAGLVAGVAWIGHIAGGKVYSARVLQNATGVKVLGCVPVKKRRFPVDAWLRRLEGRCADFGQSDVLAAAVRSLRGADGTVLVIGSGTDREREPVLKALAQAGICLRVCGALFQDAQAIEALPDCTAVLMIETCGRSAYADVSRAAEHVRALDKPLLGCILMDG